MPDEKELRVLAENRIRDAPPYKYDRQDLQFVRFASADSDLTRQCSPAISREAMRTTATGRA